jgi:hypothetical protein
MEKKNGLCLEMACTAAAAAAGPGKIRVCECR